MIFVLHVYFEMFSTFVLSLRDFNICDVVHQKLLFKEIVHEQI